MVESGRFVYGQMGKWRRLQKLNLFILLFRENALPLRTNNINYSTKLKALT